MRLFDSSLTVKELFYVIGFVATGVFQWYSIKMEINTAVYELKMANMNQDNRINIVESKIENLRRDLDIVISFPQSKLATKPEEVGVKSEKKK